MSTNHENGDSKKDVCSWIDDRRDEMVDFVLEFANVASPRGMEKPASDFLYEWLQEQDISTHQQPVVTDRSNVVSSIPGAANGEGNTLLFNAHLDTGFGNPEEDEWIVAEHHPIYYESWRDGEYLYGDDVVNDKGPLSAFVWAALALQGADVTLAGDLILTGTVGEIGGTMIDEYQDLALLGNGIGARRLVDGGITADYAIVAETTDYAIGHMECGLAWYKITVTGDVNYQARIQQPHPDDLLTDHPGALPKTAHLILELEKWAYEFQQSNTKEYDHGTNRPSAGVGAVRSGHPYSAAWAPGKAAIYLDVRLPPGERPEFVMNDLRKVIRNADVNATVETYHYRRGYIADQTAVSPLVASIERAHDDVRSGPPPHPKPEVTSMWRDINVFNEVGIPSVTFGPSRSAEEISGTKHRCLHIDDLVDVTKLYALTALDVCGAE